MTHPDGMMYKDHHEAMAHLRSVLLGIVSAGFRVTGVQVSRLGVFPAGAGPVGAGESKTVDVPAADPDARRECLPATALGPDEADTWHCPECGSSHMVPHGACRTCHDCGASGGCG